MIYAKNHIRNVPLEKKNQTFRYGLIIHTFNGSECAENKMITSFRLSSGNWASSLRILSANVLIRSGFVAHRSMTLHLMCFGNSLQNSYQMKIFNFKLISSLIMFTYLFR